MNEIRLWNQYRNRSCVLLQILRVIFEVVWDSTICVSLLQLEWTLPFFAFDQVKSGCRELNLVIVLLWACYNVCSFNSLHLFMRTKLNNVMLKECLNKTNSWGLNQIFVNIITGLHVVTNFPSWGKPKKLYSNL